MLDSSNFYIVLVQGSCSPWWFGWFGWFMGETDIAWALLLASNFVIAFFSGIKLLIVHINIHLHFYFLYCYYYFCLKYYYCYCRHLQISKTNFNVFDGVVVGCFNQLFFPISCKFSDEMYFLDFLYYFNIFPNFFFYFLYILILSYTYFHKYHIILTFTSFIYDWFICWLL